MKLKSFKIFESVSELKTILNAAIVHLVDEFDPEFSLDSVETNGLVQFKFDFKNNGPYNSDIESMNKCIMITEKTIIVYRMFVTIMKKLKEEGYMCKITKDLTNTPGKLTIQLSVAKII